MGFNTAAGTSIAIGSASTYSGSSLISTNGATDTYVVIGQVTNIPEFGRVYKEVPFSPLATRGVQKVKGSFDEGSLQIDLARDTSDAGQVAALIAREVDANYNFKVQFNDGVAPLSATVTMTIAAPGVVTDTAPRVTGTPVKLSTTGALPTGLVAGTTYYVTSPSGNTYSLASTYANALLGTGITTTGSQSGVHTMTTAPAGSFVIFCGQVASFTSIVGTIDAVMMRKMNLMIQSGSMTETVKNPAV